MPFVLLYLVVEIVAVVALASWIGFGWTLVVLLAARQALYSYSDPGYPRPRWRPDAFDAARDAAAVLVAYLVVRLLLTVGRRLVARPGDPESA